MRRMFALSLLILSLSAGVLAQPADSLAEIRRQISILTEEIERLKLGAVDETVYQSVTGLGPAASKVYGLKKSGVSLAGYGELLYENFSAKLDNGSAASSRDQFDYLRHILYVGYRFNDVVLFNSELEVEHASTGKGGEVSMEFGYIDLLFSKGINVRAGMVLVPVGISNEKHEPPTFPGTARPAPERVIIPSTWRANGAGIFGEPIDDLHYRAYVVEGLNMQSFSASDGIRGGRQSGAKAVVEDMAVTGRVEYRGFAGAEVGASIFAGNSGQGAKDSVGSEISAQTVVVSVHGEYIWRGLEVRALIAQASVDEADRVAGYQRWKSGASTAPVIGSTMSGYYATIGYDIMPLIARDSKHVLAPFMQYEAYNTHASVPAGRSASASVDRTTLVVGCTWKPHPNVAFKADYRDNANGATTATDQWNVAVTYLY